MTLGDVVCRFAAEDIRGRRRMDVQADPTWDEVETLRRLLRVTRHHLREMLKQEWFGMERERAIHRARLWSAQLDETHPEK